MSLKTPHSKVPSASNSAVAVTSVSTNAQTVQLRVSALTGEVVIALLELSNSAHHLLIAHWAAVHLRNRREAASPPRPPPLPGHIEPTECAHEQQLGTRNECNTIGKVNRLHASAAVKRFFLEARVVC